MTHTYFMHYRRTLLGHYQPRAPYDEVVDSRGGATLAIRVIDPTRAVVSIARCSSEDVFNKKIGRTVATGRLDAYISDTRNVEDFIRIIPLAEGVPVKDAVDGAVGQELAELGLF